MESYIEVSFLNGVFLMYCSLIYASYIMLHPLNSCSIWIYSISISLLSVLLWNKNSYIYIICVECLCFFWLFRYAKKTYLVALIFRFLCIGTTFVLYGGSFHNGFYFVPIRISIVLVWMIYFGFVVYARSRWRIKICEKNCVYPVTLWINNKKIRVLGYFDSGNLLSYHGIPVVFMSDLYRSYFQNQSIDIVMKTVLNAENIKCYRCMLQLDGCKRKEVYVHLQKDLNLPCECNLILNMKVMVS